jgi:hypothetical protein
MASVFDWAVVVDHTHVGLFEYRPTGEARAFRGGRDFVGRWSETPTLVGVAVMAGMGKVAAERIHFTPSERGAFGICRSVVGDPDVG